MGLEQVRLKRAQVAPSGSHTHKTGIRSYTQSQNTKKVGFFRFEIQKPRKVKSRSKFNPSEQGPFRLGFRVLKLCDIVT